MKDKIRFIHCSDVHLGANPYGIRERFEDMGRVFKSVLNYAKDSQIDFFIIAGDLFDKKNLNAETLEQAMDIIKLLNDKNIPIYVTEGNHDMASYINSYSWLDFMSTAGMIKLLTPVKDDEKVARLTLFDEETKKGSYIESDDYIIYGLGYPGILSSKYLNTLTDCFVDNKEDKVVISMLHTGIDKFVTEGMGGVKEEDIAPLIEKSDYIALGHIHQRYESESGKYYNPGSLENSSIPQKIEEKGFFEVTIDTKDKKVDAKFIEIANRKIINETVDLNAMLDEAGSIEKVEDLIIKYIKEVMDKNNIINEDHAILELKIKGEIVLGVANLKFNEIKEKLKNEFEFLYVEVQNKLINKRESKDIDIETLTREEIDKNAIRGLICDEAFDEEDIDFLVDITLKMKELTQDGELTLEKNDGKTIKDMVLDIVRKKDNDKNEEEIIDDKEGKDEYRA